MGKLRVLSGSEICQILEQNGWPWHRNSGYRHNIHDMGWHLRRLGNGKCYGYKQRPDHTDSGLHWCYSEKLGNGGLRGSAGFEWRSNRYDSKRTPVNVGSDSGLEFFHVYLADTGLNTTAINSGPNQGYQYIANQLDYSLGYFHYVINPDLMNQGSAFSQHQYGRCGWIAWSNLNTQTIRHESGNPGHYSEYTQALAANNPGSYLEPIIAGPADNANLIFGNARNQTTSMYSSIGTSAAQENIPPVNYSATNTFLGNINYAPYAACP